MGVLLRDIWTLSASESHADWCRSAFELSFSTFSFDGFNGQHVPVTGWWGCSSTQSLKLCEACDNPIMLSMAYHNSFCSEVNFSILDDTRLLVHDSAPPTCWTSAGTHLILPQRQGQLQSLPESF